MWRTVIAEFRMFIVAMIFRAIIIITPSNTQKGRDFLVSLRGPIKITITDKFWIVTNPTHLATIGDILFQTDLKGLENQIMGARYGGYNMTDIGMTIYSDESSARKDAEKRMEA